MTDDASSPPGAGDTVENRDILLHRSVLESMTEGVMTVTAAGRIGILNPAASRMLGLTGADVRGRLFGDVFLSRDGLEEFNDTVLGSVYDQAVGTRSTVSLRLGDDTERSAEVTTSYLVRSTDGETERIGIVVVLDDVTEVAALRKAEQELAESTKAQNVELRDAYRQIEEQNRALGSALKRVQVVRVVAMLLVVVLFVGAAWYVRSELGAAFPQAGSGASATPAEEVTVTVAPRRLVSTLSFVGTLAPRSERPVTSPLTGRVADVFFEYGDRVAAGQLLVQLDTAETNRRYLEASARYLEARDRLRELENWENAPAVKRARQAVVISEMELDESENDRAASALLLERGIIAASEHRNAQQRYEARRLRHETAQRELEDARAKAGADAVKIALLRLETAATGMRELEQALQNATIRAPIAGVVLQSAGDRGRGSAEQGDGRPLAAGQLVNEGGHLLTIGDLSGLSVSGGVDEVDVVKVAPGQPVRVSGDAFPDLVFEGTIVTISPQSRTRGTSGVPTFDVTAAIERLADAHLKRLRLGMSANVTVVVRDKPGVLLVPLAAVDGSPGNYRVRVRSKDGGAPRDVPVEVGETTLYEVEILSGIEAGDEVIVSTS